MSAETQPSSTKRNNLRRILPTALVMGAAVLMGGDAEAASKSTPKTQSTPDKGSLIGEALQKFGKRINEQHVGRIAMNTCVAWFNNKDGMTVTYNPGYIHLTSHTKKLGRTTASFFVWASQEVGPAQGFPARGLKVANSEPRLTALNGKYVFDGMKETTLQIHYDGKSLQQSLATRHVDPRLANDSHGYQGYFTDAENGQPILRTRLLEGSVTPKQLVKVCNQLRKPDPAA